MNRRQTAKGLLVHYFKTCFRLAGVQFDSDNRTEVEEIIDAIFDEIDEQRDDWQADAEQAD